MKKVVVIAMMLGVSFGVLAQGVSKGVAISAMQEYKLKVGDKIPFTEIHNMINYPTKTLKFSDHKAKLTILDFWGTTCASCVYSWPHLIKMKEKFGNDLDIILVNSFEREKLIRDFIKTRKKYTGVDMTMSMSLRDSTIWKYFPERGLPRIYWLTPDGVIRSVTNGVQLNETNIARWIDKGSYEMPQIIDEWTEINRTRPIYVDGNGGNSKADSFIWTSSLTKAQKAVFAEADFYWNPKRGYAVTATGMSIKELYAVAYNNRIRSDDFISGPPVFGLPYSRIVLEVDDTLKYSPIKRTTENTYNYQVISGAPKTKAELQQLMKEDIKRYFKLEASWEKRKKMCIVWTMFDSTLAKRQKSSIVKDVYIGDTEVSLDSTNVHNAILFMELGTLYFNSPYPIVDETNYKGLLIGIRYDGNGYDLKQFDKDMSKYGFHIRLEPREVEILVLREPKVPE